MRRYYITDRAGLGGSIEALLACIERNAVDGVDFIQIREKDLSARDLLDLTRRAVSVAANARILVNDRADIAIAAGAHGVHLRSNSLPVAELRRIVPPNFLVAVSCHTLADIDATQQADFVVFSPVFPSPGKGESVGIEGLREAARRSAVPVFALGGISEQNAGACIRAGAAGLAAIRLFQGVR